MNSYTSAPGWSKVYDVEKWPSPSSSSSTHSSSSSQLENSTGTFAVRYQGTSEWDCTLETASEPIDISLALPHFRTRNQPIEHKLSTYLSSRTGPIRAKMCRPAGSRQPFYLEVHSDAGEVTLWLPSDFAGHIRCAHPAAPARARSSSVASQGSLLPRKSAAAPQHPTAAVPQPSVSFSAGFTNRIFPHARMNEDAALDDLDGAEDEVFVCARKICLRMWDVAAAAPESRTREAWRRMFGCTKRAPETSIDWDFLLSD